MYDQEFEVEDEFGSVIDAYAESLVSDEHTFSSARRSAKKSISTSFTKWQEELFDDVDD